MRIITFGTFDNLHKGHMNILQKSKNYNNKDDNYLIVGVSSDELNKKKGKECDEDYDTRINKLKKLGFIDEIFMEKRLEDKKLYCKQYKADILIMGDDWIYQFDWVGIPCIYLPRTDGISTTKIKIEEMIKNKNKYKYGFVDVDHSKHNSYYISVSKMLNKYNLYNEIVTDFSQKNLTTYTGFILFNIIKDEDRIQYNLNGLLSCDVPLYLIDHGCSNLKFFLIDEYRYKMFDYIFVAGKGMKKSIDSYIGSNNTMVISTAFAKSQELLEAIETSKKREIIDYFGLDINDNIILYAPTWFNDDDSYDISSLEIKNMIISYHPDSKKNDHKFSSYDLLKICDIIISDSSSMLFEGARLSKKTIQLFLQNYPDNFSENDLPYQFGTFDLFNGGILTTINNLPKTINQVKILDYTFFKHIHKNILKIPNITNDADDIIVYNLLKYKNKNNNKNYHIIESFESLIQPTKILHGNKYFILKINEIESLDKINTLNKDKIILEFYNLEEYLILEKYQFNNCLFALWKHYESDPFDDIVYYTLDYITLYGNVNLFGISLSNYNPITDQNNCNNIKLNQLLSYGKRIFIHNIRNNEIIQPYLGKFDEEDKNQDNSEKCSLIYRILLNRYPDYESNKFIIHKSSYIKDKLIEINNSYEYKKYGKNKLTYDNQVFSIYKDNLKIIDFQFINWNTSNDIYKDLFSKVEFCITNKIYPTNIIIVKNTFLIIDYINKVSTFFEIYIEFKKELLRFTYNKFNVIFNISKPEINHKDLVVFYYNLLLNRIPSNSEIYSYVNNEEHLLNIYGSSEYRKLNNNLSIDLIEGNRIIVFNDCIKENKYVMIENKKYNIFKYRLLNLSQIDIKLNLLVKLGNLYLPLNCNNDYEEVNDYNLKLLQHYDELNKVQINEKDHSIVVNIIYKYLFDRYADIEGLNSKVYLLKDGQMNYYDILNEMINSLEFKIKLKDKINFDKIFQKDIILPELNRNLKGMKVKYYGPYGTSGYAICCKLIIWALYNYGIDIQYVPISLYNFTEKTSIYDDLLLKLYNNKLDKYDIIIVHSVPDQWPYIISQENDDIPKYGITVWETDTIHKEWIDFMSIMDMISCPCEYNKETFEKDIKSIPIEKVYHPIVLLNEETDDDYITNIFKENDINQDTYIFYSINEYNGRKGITDLINLYMENFTNNDNVFLYIKTSGEIKKDECYEYLDKLKLVNPNHPKIYIDYNILSEEQINSIHKSCNCYISLSKAEGTGYTSCQAVLFNKPIIIGNYSASPEYIKYAHYIDVNITPVLYCDKNYSKHNSCPPNYCIYNKWYDINYQNWGIPKIDQALNIMKYCFNNKINTGDIRSKEYILNNFNFQKVAENFYFSFKKLLNTKINHKPNTEIELIQLPSIFKDFFQSNDHFHIIDGIKYKIIYF